MLTYAQVEQRRYIQAVIQETLRLHPGVVARLPGVSPTKPIVYPDKRNETKEEMFEDPIEFRPQRWIDKPRLDRAFLSGLYVAPETASGSCFFLLECEDLISIG
ncbi:hypothetical protein BJY01DRAFT_220612 [Aspergillus pseudoustus]|uniref:Cytochrome P450 n=1 Tax=Aspergillus pseudoustus TaxID=1810923 RepID=A0ABR4JCK3_9EURO